MQEKHNLNNYKIFNQENKYINGKIVLTKIKFKNK